MTVRRSSSLFAIVLWLLLACGPAVGGPVSTDGPSSPPPAEVLDATVVFFDADGRDEQLTAPELGAITDAGGLDEFTARYVDGEPELGPAAAEARAAGKVLIGGVVSSGCFPADGADLVLVADGVRLLPIGLRDEDPDIACYRAITSVALVAIDPVDLPDASIQGT